MEILLVRHARPIRVTGVDGEPDPPLGPLGRAQVKGLEKYLADDGIGAIYASPLLRARQTAEPISKVFGLGLRVEEDLNELHLGQDHYIPVEEMGADAAKILSQIRAPIAGGGTNPLVTSFRHRSLNVVDRIARDHQDMKVVAVCHLGVINAVVTAILGIAELVAFELDYTSVTRIRISTTGMRAVRSVNEAPHLLRCIELESC